MKRQRQQQSQQRQRSLLASSPSWLLLATALTIPTLLYAFAPNTAVHNKRSIQHQSAHYFQVKHHMQMQPSPSFLSHASDTTTSLTKLFARGPGRPSAASLEEDDDDDLDFEDDDDAEEDEGKLVHM